jgi:hypothetical protein
VRRHALRANDRKFPFDAPLSGLSARHEPARDRIVSLAMMRGGAFILLKVGQGRRKTAKQAEVRFADLPTILSILRSNR